MAAPTVGIPPWLTPPDPVATYQRGLQIGANIAAQQAEQRIAQERIAASERASMAADARAQQEQAMQQAQFEQQLAFKREQDQRQAAEAARRVQGQMRYQSLVQGGADPLQAMMQVPELWGDSLTGVASAMKEEERLKRLETWKPSEMTTEGGARMTEVSPGRWQVIKAPLSLTPKDVQTMDVPGTDSMVVVNPNGTFHVVKKSEEGPSKATKAAQVKFLEGQLRAIDSRIAKDDPDAPQLKVQRRRIIKELEALGVAQPGMFDEVDASETPIGTAATLPKVRSIKRIQ